MSAVQIKTDVSPVYLVHDHYDRWSTRVFSLLMLCYTMFFLVRLNFALAAPYLSTALALSKAQIGSIMSLSMLVFSAGKLVCGFVGLQRSPKSLLAIGLVGSSCMNLCICLCSSGWDLALVIAANAAFQSLAWPQCIRLMKDWCSSQQLGRRWSLLSLSYQFGSVLIFSCLALLVERFGWQATFLAPGIVGSCLGLLIVRLPLDPPAKLGLPTREERFGLDSQSEEAPNCSSWAEAYAIAREILASKRLWLVSGATFFVYAVRTGFSFWAPCYLNECTCSPVTVIGTLMLTFEIAGALGGLCAGWLSDTLFAGERKPVALIYFVAIVGFLLLFCVLPRESLLANSICLAGLGFAITGPQIMTGTASFDVSSKKAAVAANGFCGLFAGFGSALLSGATVGLLAQTFGWSAVFGMLAASAAVGAALFHKVN